MEKKKFHIAGIGASAGGLETFQKFFRNMAKDSGLAFVLVQHLHPDHESLMPELLSKYTDMPVLSAGEDMKIEPDHVYVIPSNSTLTMKNGYLHLEKPSESRGHRMPIDHFFRSLSEDWGEKAICIILSGTGSDGTLGLKAVKEQGGLVIAQNPETAKYDSMPRNAICTNQVDMVLNVEEMPQVLLKFLDKSDSLRKEMEDSDDTHIHLDAIFGVLEERTNHEFHDYKRNTVLRRIRRRMQILHIDSLKVYAEKVREDHEESTLLFKDLLIGVTHFFRDPRSFEYLQERIIPGILQKKQEINDNRGIRVWVAGCATGEEAYTLALIIRDEISKKKMNMPVQIFATDIDENALMTARRATYSEGISEQIPAQYLDRYFHKQGNSYCVNKNIREMCVFSPHNIISDPPYSRLDLITCRNLLIYFDSSLQGKVLPIFHYALNSDGYLFLGPSENISAKPQLFKAISKSHRIFQARKNVPPSMIDFPLGRRPSAMSISKTSPGEQKKENEKILAQTFERKILEQYIPFSAVINEDADILYWAGPRLRYLDLPRGVPRNNLLDIAHKSLRLTLRSALHKVIQSKEESIHHDVMIKTHEGLQRLMVNLSPFQEMGQGSGLFIVVIREMSAPAGSSQKGMTETSTEGEEINRQLEQELKDTKVYPQSTIEELETSNEELKSSNEELLSMNEELQSSNEEMQTSKEELQSVNEELETVNSELKNKITELDDANSDLHNLYESTQIATVFLDNGLCIKDFTPAATTIFRIIESDKGRPINDVVHLFSGADLAHEARIVLRKLEKSKIEVKHKETLQEFYMQISPYRSVNNTIDGVTISFFDITQLQRAKQDLEIRENMLRLVTDSMPVLVSYVDSNQTYRYCNAVYEQWFGLSKQQVIGRTVKEVVGDDAYAAIRQHVEQALSGKRSRYTGTLPYQYDGDRSVLVQYEPHITADGTVHGFIAFIQDESERMARAQKLGRLAAIVNSSHEVIIGKTSEGIIADWNKGAEELYGYSANEAIGQHINLIVPPEHRQEMEAVYEKLRRGENITPFETVRRTKEGEKKSVLLCLSLIKGESGESYGISAVAHDITERVRAEADLQELKLNLEQRVDQRTRQLRDLTARFLAFEQRERRKFSQYLHDEIQQALVTARLRVEQVRNIANNENVEKNLSAALQRLDEAINNSRSVTTDISPPLFFESGISVCLEWLTRWARTSLDLQVQVNLTGDDRPISDEGGYIIYRSLRELLFNIHKHAKVREAMLHVKFQDDGGINITVEDKGKGFEPERVIDSTGEKYGILSVKEQVEALLGKIAIKSSLQNGTCINIHLPTEIITFSRNAEAKEQGEPIQPERVEKEDKPLILVVDDQEDLRFLLVQMLNDLTFEYTIMEAHSGEKGLELALKHKPQLILMDINMPGMSGIEATRKIKTEMEEMIIFALSMHEEEHMAKACSKLVPQSILEKMHLLETYSPR
ncbi:chemotaxis protein CheB [Desulfopila inferna]|uniref:chemotaxis protein CheB n=1 Tax=Desulfopila inferna TaxID=468528 RepID=UPI0019642385|nr:chemotaxis protein CheB [Desulfopila inferna]MBM9605616.1 PAS domain S-box protein [Desulfopila inferna]